MSSGVNNLPKGQKDIGVMWVYKAKKNAKGIVEKIQGKTCGKREIFEYGLALKGEANHVEGYFICQERYAKEILKRFDMDRCNPVGTPIDHKEKPLKHDRREAVDLTLFKSLVGCLCYLACTRPDILFAVGLVSRFIEEPTTKHLKIAKRILHYIKGIVDYDMFYSISEDFKLVAYSDSD
ncbi:hypothetical protein Tco_0860633 [Tanacetum coccineum]|uniref:Reverse transcriptase Ty1/copia-type domain-containing protein n=1 Tax=Tanacetum coccineum TaxID=301880 RepID=A0ABQ5BIW3_9ASTR